MENVEIEKQKCAENFSYFAGNFLHVQHPVKGAIRFVPYDFQNYCMAMIQRDQKVVIAKARQMGVSTMFAAYAVWVSLFHANSRVAVITHSVAAADHFCKKVYSMLTMLPLWSIPSRVCRGRDHIIINDNEIYVGPHKKMLTGTKFTAILLDEAAFYDDLSSVVDAAQRYMHEDSKMIIASTCDRPGSDFMKICDDAKNTMSRFSYIELPWHLNPQFDLTWYLEQTQTLSSDCVKRELLCQFA